MNFSVGEQVSILMESGIFIVVQTQIHSIIIEDEDGFQRSIPRHLVVKRNVIKSSVVIKDLSQDQKCVTRKKAKNTIPSIDLHAEALGLNASIPQNLLRLQLNACRQFLNDCIKNRQVKCTIIHGVGDGTLRSSVRQMLAQKKGIQYHDANISPRGVGSTLVEIKIQSVTLFQ